MRQTLSLLAAVGVAVLIGGCTTDTDREAAPTSAATSAATDMTACLKAKGWDVDHHPNGSYSAEVPTEQVEALEAAGAECYVELGYDQPVTRAQAAAYFDSLLDTAACIQDLGYEVADPPSRQAAIEEIMKPIIDLEWYPYQEPILTASSVEEINRVYLSCPSPSLF